MKPTAIWITGTYDANTKQNAATQAWEGTNFTPCRIEDATHVSVYLVSEEDAEPVKDFPINGDLAKAHVDALTLAAGLQDLPIKDTLQALKVAKVADDPTYPRVEMVRGHKHTCANVQPGSTAADVCDCGAVADGKSVPTDRLTPAVTYFARLLGKAKWEAVSKAEFDSYQMGSLYETKTEPVCEAATWYAEAMAASNELGYAGMDAASVIRHLGETVQALKEAQGKAVDQLQKVTEVDRCECCSELFLGVSKDTKYCPFCGTKHKGETAKVVFTGDPIAPFMSALEGDYREAMDITARRIAYAALGIHWKDTESPARAVADYAAEHLVDRNQIELELRWFTQAVKQLCKDFSDLQDRPYMGDVTSALDSLLEQCLTCDRMAKYRNVQPALTVWEGPMPESNGRSNFTAVLMRKGAPLFDGLAGGMTIARSEYPDRVRYEADRMRFLIGEMATEPDILQYDTDKHSGYSR